MKPNDIAEALEGLIEARQPTIVWGPPGVGKSSVIQETGRNLGREIVDIRAVLLDPVDLRGIPHITKSGEAKWAPPSFLPKDKDSTAIIFLDELAQAAPLVQSACLQLTLDRRIGEYELPQGCSIVAASNRQSDRAGAHRLISPLLNRFVHLSLEVSIDDWRAWAIANGINGMVLAYLAFKPDQLFAFNPKSKDESFPTPRSWEFVSNALQHTPKRLMFGIVSGCVGEGAAAEFVSFCEMYGKLPKPEDVLANPMQHTVPTEPSVLYARAGSLATYLKEHTDKMNEYAQFVSRMPQEFGVLGMRDGVGAVGVQLVRTPAGAEWAKKNASVLTGSTND